MTDETAEQKIQRWYEAFDRQMQVTADFNKAVNAQLESLRNVSDSQSHLNDSFHTQLIEMKETQAETLELVKVMRCHIDALEQDLNSLYVEQYGVPRNDNNP